jgi:hypothetical protein
MLNVQLNIENYALNFPWKHEIRLTFHFLPFTVLEGDFFSILLTVTGIHAGTDTPTCVEG